MLTRKVRCQAGSVYRAMNAGRIGCVIAADYKLHAWRAKWNDWDKADEVYTNTLSRVHQRSADVR